MHHILLVTVLHLILLPRGLTGISTPHLRLVSLPLGQVKLTEATCVCKYMHLTA